jgi:holo-[acyl-carrier protein] synthase
MKSAYERWGERFLKKIFTEGEIEYSFSKHNPYLSLAARFAAKEAGFKALSQAGIRIVRWQDMEICRSAEGEPTLELTEISGVTMHLSLSHTHEMAVAMVVAEVMNE